MSDLIAVTSYTGRLRHYANDEDLSNGRGHLGSGRVGRALCHNSIQTSVYDQEAFDEDRRKWNAAYVSKPIESLPLCKKCAKAGAA